MLEPPSSPPFSSPPIALCLVVAAIATSAALAGIAVAGRPSRRPVDVCGLPAGMELGALGARDRSFAVRRALACVDLMEGRISLDEYREVLHPPPPAVVVPAIVWASRVISASSEYAPVQWAANRVLGAPDVFPGSGDNQLAWASRDSDAPVERLQVAFDTPLSLHGLQIFETYNPGAVTRVELISATGERTTVYDGAAGPMTTPAFQRNLEFGCTADPIASVEITLDSGAVPGWNEIDAVGALPCQM